MKTILPTLSLLFLAALILFGAEQLHLNLGGSANSGSGDTLRSALAKVQTNFNNVFPSRFATNGNYTMDGDILIQAWTGTAVAGIVTLPAASSASPTNIIRLILKDEGGNAGTTNITYVPVSGDRIDGVGVFITHNSNYQVTRIYSVGGTNWFTW